MGTTNVLMTPLKGSNYATWKVQCRMALIKEGLWGIVNGTESISEDASNDEKNKFALKRDKALATIVLSVDPTLLYILGPEPNDPSKVWGNVS